MNKFFIPSVRIFIVLFLFVLSLQNYGNLPVGFINGLFFVLLSTVTLLYYQSDSKLNFGYTLFSVLMTCLILVVPFFYKLFCLSVYLYLLILFKKSCNHSYSGIISLFVTSIVLAFFSCFYQYNSAVWHIVQRISHGFSSIVSLPFINPNGYKGTAYSGVFTLLVFFVYFISVFINSVNRRIFLFCFLLLTLFLSFFTYSLLQYLALQFAANIKPVLFEALFHYETAFIFLIPSTLILIKKYPQRDDFGIELNVIVNKRNIVALVSIVFSFFILTFNVTSLEKKGRIFLYQKGSFNWDLPTYNKFGALSGGMFGLLPEFLKDMKYYVIEDSVINYSNLQNADILVLINLNEKLSVQDKQLIWKFVKNGGSLLALGDHTGKEAIRDPYNDLLEPVDIRFNFDCGMPFVEHWERGLEFRPHYITQRLENNTESNIGIGATLTTGNQSKPIIIGKYGYSDSGNPLNISNGYLGNMLFSIDETSGDIVLVAEQSFGKGKVMVFGDTSPFQNSEIIQDYRFLIDIIDYLSNPNHHIRYALIISLLLLLSGLIIAVYKHSFNVSVLLVFLICGYLATFINGKLNRHRSEINFDAKIAYIDKTHMERFNFDQWDPDGIGGTGFCFIRSDYFPLQLDQFEEEKIFRSKCLLIIAPAKPFNTKEVNILNTYLQQGGYVILGCGWEESNTIKALLESVDMAVLNIPLGNLNRNQNTAMVSMPNAWAVNSKGGQFEILSQSSGFPVIIFKRINKGGLFLIGDSEFFLNFNIEEINSYNITNILFIRSLLQKINN